MTKQRTNISTLKDAAQQATTELDPYPRFAAKLNTLDRDFYALLGSNTEVARFKRVVLNAIVSKPELLQAEPRSLLLACMRAAQDGLMLDNREAVLNIYNTKVKEGNVERWEQRAQYLPMVAGMVKRLFASGAITYLDAAAVYAGDTFEYTRGDQVSLVHKPTMGERGDLVAAYCVMRLKSGELKREVMTRSDIDRVRAASKTSDKGPWVEWFDQQAIKSVIKRAYKQIDADTSVDRLIEHDNETSGLANALPGRIQGDTLLPPPTSAPPPADDEPPPPPPPPAPASRMAGQTVWTQAQLYDEIANRIADAEDNDDLDLARDLLTQIENADARRELDKLLADREAVLQQ